VSAAQIIFPAFTLDHSGYCLVEKVITSPDTQLVDPAEMVNLIPPAALAVENCVPLVAAPTFPDTEPTTEKVATPSAPPNVQVSVLRRARVVLKAMNYRGPQVSIRI